MQGRDPLFVPCTPLGCIQLLERNGIAIKGKRAVVVGRSNIVGMPAAMLLNKRDATVTICHSRTEVRLPVSVAHWLCRLLHTGRSHMDIDISNAMTINLMILVWILIVREYVSNTESDGTLV